MYLKVKDCAMIKQCTINAIRLAINCKKLKAEKMNGKWIVTVEDLFDYEKNKFNRDLSLFKGKLRFDQTQGELSVRKACRLYKLDEQKLYYSLRKNKLPGIKKGGTWVINIADIEKYTSERKMRSKQVKYKTKWLAKLASR